jgi:hypothetical protein
VSERLLAVCLAVYSACALLGILPGAVLASRARQPALAALAVVVALFTAAVLANGAADLW